MKENKFIQGVEKLIDPINVGTLHFLQSFNNKLPKNIQKTLIEKASKESSLMGFVVEPYCYFLCYEITNTDIFEKLIPDNFELIKTKIFDDDSEKYYFILACFNARTSAFFGSRLEAYAIAKNLDTNLTSWVILDYDTNTISYDPKNGLTGPSVSQGVVTTDYLGQVVVNMKRSDGSKELSFTSSLKNGKLKDLYSNLWIEGNLSVAYSKKLSDTGDVFSLRFNPQELKEALEIDIEDLNINKNTWYNDFIEDNPSKLVCFPYAQHFLSDAPGTSTHIRTEQELVENIKSIKFENIKSYSNDMFTKMVMVLPVITIILVILIIVLMSLLFFTSL